MTELGGQSVTFSRRTMLIAAMLTGAAVLAGIIGPTVAWVAAAATFVTEGGLAALVFLSAGGYGYLVIRRMAPSSAPAGLRVFSACMLGLWMLSTLMLAAGSLFHDLLKPYVWWPIIGLGVLAAAIQARHTLSNWRPAPQTDGRALLWVLLAAAGAFWIAGATLPAGWTGRGTCDFYDVLEYHLQLPREYFNAQHIAPLTHNCYSFYPLGTEMLYLLAMCLRNGAYDGMYAANAIPGCFAVVAIGAVFSCLRAGGESRARFAAGLLGTTPFVLYLSGLAMVELAMVACLTLALLWLRQWITDRSLGSAACLGLMVGASLTVKYLSVGFVAGPVLAALLILAILHRRRFRLVGQAIAAGVIALALFSPWLVRNTVSTGNPVFPLATQVMGSSHWSPESRQRWEDGHGPQVKPPVPQPASWTSPGHTDWLASLLQEFVLSPMYSPLMMLLAMAGIATVLAREGSRDLWNCSLVGVLAAQVAVWLTCTHQSPARFIVPAVVPLTLLAGEVLTVLSQVKQSPFKGNVLPNTLPGANFSGRSGIARPWGFMPAVALFVAVVAVNLFSAWGIFNYTTAPVMPGTPAEELTWRKELIRSKHIDVGDQARFLLVGQGECFYFPPGTVYATAFDANPLADIAARCTTPQQMLAEFKGRGITHLWVNWAEIIRLANTYGYPATIGEDVLRRYPQEPAGCAMIDQLTPLGLTTLCEFAPMPTPQTKGASHPAWPIITVYALPGIP